MIKQHDDGDGGQIITGRPKLPPVVKPPPVDKTNQVAAVLDSFDSITNPTICAVVIGDQLPAQSGYVWNTSFAVTIAEAPLIPAAPPVGTIYFNNHTNQKGGTIVYVDTVARTVVSLTSNFSTVAGVDYSTMFRYIKHNGAFNVHGFTNPNPIDRTQLAIGTGVAPSYIVNPHDIASDGNAFDYVGSGSGAYDAKTSFRVVYSPTTDVTLLGLRLFAVKAGDPFNNNAGVNDLALTIDGTFTGAIFPGLGAGTAYDCYIAFLDTAGIASAPTLVGTTNANGLTIARANQAKMPGYSGIGSIPTPVCTFTSSGAVFLGSGATTFDMSGTIVTDATGTTTTSNWIAEIKLLASITSLGKYKEVGSYSPSSSTSLGSVLFGNLGMGNLYDLVLVYVDYAGNWSNYSNLLFTTLSNPLTIPNVLDASGNIIATEFPGQLVLQTSGTYKGYYKQVAANVVDQRGFNLTPGNWLWMDWNTVLTASGSGPFVASNASVTNYYYAYFYSGGGQFVKSGTGIGPVFPANPAFDGNAHVISLGIQYNSATSVRVQCLLDGVLMADYIDTSASIGNVIYPGFSAPANSAYHRDFDFYSSVSNKQLTGMSTTQGAPVPTGISAISYPVVTGNASYVARVSFDTDVQAAPWLEGIRLYAFDSSYPSPDPTKAGDYGTLANVNNGHYVCDYSGLGAGTAYNLYYTYLDLQGHESPLSPSLGSTLTNPIGTSGFGPVGTTAPNPQPSTPTPSFAYVSNGASTFEADFRVYLDSNGTTTNNNLAEIEVVISAASRSLAYNNQASWVASGAPTLKNSSGIYDLTAAGLGAGTAYQVGVRYVGHSGDRSFVYIVGTTNPNPQVLTNLPSMGAQGAPVPTIVSGVTYPVIGNSTYDANVTFTADVHTAPWLVGIELWATPVPNGTVLASGITVDAKNFPFGFISVSQSAAGLYNATWTGLGASNHAYYLYFSYEDAQGVFSPAAFVGQTLANPAGTTGFGGVPLTAPVQTLAPSTLVPISNGGSTYSVQGTIYLDSQSLSSNNSLAEIELVCAPHYQAVGSTSNPTWWTKIGAVSPSTSGTITCIWDKLGTGVSYDLGVRYVGHNGSRSYVYIAYTNTPTGSLSTQNGANLVYNPRFFINSQPGSTELFDGWGIQANTSGGQISALIENSIPFANNGVPGGATAPPDIVLRVGSYIVVPASTSMYIALYSTHKFVVNSGDIISMQMVANCSSLSAIPAGITFSFVAFTRINYSDGSQDQCTTATEYRNGTPSFATYRSPALKVSPTKSVTYCDAWVVVTVSNSTGSPITLGSLMGDVRITSLFVATIDPTLYQLAAANFPGTTSSPLIIDPVTGWIEVPVNTYAVTSHTYTTPYTAGTSDALLQFKFIGAHNFVNAGAFFTVCFNTNLVAATAPSSSTNITSGYAIDHNQATQQFTIYKSVGGTYYALTPVPYSQQTVAMDTNIHGYTIAMDNTSGPSLIGIYYDGRVVCQAYDDKVTYGAATLTGTFAIRTTSNADFLLDPKSFYTEQGVQVFQHVAPPIKLIIDPRLNFSIGGVSEPSIKVTDLQNASQRGPTDANYPGMYVNDYAQCIYPSGVFAPILRGVWYTNEAHIRYTSTDNLILIISDKSFNVGDGLGGGYQFLLGGGNIVIYRRPDTSGHAGHSGFVNLGSLGYTFDTANFHKYTFKIIYTGPSTGASYIRCQAFIDDLLVLDVIDADSYMTGGLSYGYFGNTIGNLILHDWAFTVGDPLASGTSHLNGIRNVTPTNSLASLPTYTNSSSTINISVPSFTVIYGDDAVTGGASRYVTPSGSVPFSGLTATSTYYFMISVDTRGAAAVVVTQCGGPGITSSPAQRITASQDGIILLVTDYQALTTTSGSSSGGGGAPGGGGRVGCPADYQLIEEMDRGFIRADELTIGDYLRDPFDGWNEVYALEKKPTNIWRITTDVESVDVNDTHAVMLESGEWCAVKDLAQGDRIRAYPNGACTVNEAKEIGPGSFIAIGCARHRYVLGKAIGHNYTL